MDWFEAARMGDTDALHICLVWGQRVDARDADGRTALCLAAEHGHTDAVNLLLGRNADPNLAAPDGPRPLTAAVDHERWEMATALVRRGADPNADGVASIVIAEPPKRKLLALMLEHGLDPHGAHPEWGPYVDFGLNDPACWDMFLVAGFDLARHERETGESLLERALSHGVNRFLHLLSLGANINLPVDRARGRTMLMTLAGDEPTEQNHALIRLLLQRGADLDQRDGYGSTAFDYAAEREGEDKPTLTLLTRLRKERLLALEREQKRLAKAEAKARAAEAAQAKREQQRIAKAEADARAAEAAQAKRERQRQDKAEADARAAEAAKATRERNNVARQAAAAARQAAAAAREAVAAERRAAREFERLEKAQAKLAARAAAAVTPEAPAPESASAAEAELAAADLADAAPDSLPSTPAPAPKPKTPRQRRRPLRDFAVSERHAKSEVDAPAAKQSQHG